MKNDWHPAEVIAAIRKKGSTLSALSRRAGLSGSTLGNALNRRWPKGEKIIADYLGVEACVIWPSRYQDNNQKTKE
ncbi:transcriptional regulator [Yersinia mollaretii]|uniref:Transcriptional regulator n=1 Tax=Yersinia mollaretii TaxID=33060 RepID=A0AA44I0N0_YERMO|nr:helix-turn-helix transcriptional regulator [Yersinia mollaretii]NIL23564.1 transcriptional regulator [Yersinia mollaretii]CNI30586.1 putative DNA-binding protein [Yersinia mollaretii]CNJ86449.1 putative DNA-binding protein [Yersinia mollaretii]CQQ54306.1 putative DNA-binding protein [Yersinia mollaretii]